MALPSAVDAAAAAAEASFAQRNPVAADQLSEDIRTAARVASVTDNAIRSSPARGNVSGRRHPDGRRKRKGLPLGTKLQIAAWKEAGKFWAWIRSQLAEDYSWTAIKSAYRDRVALRSRLVEGARESSDTARGSAYSKVDSRLAEWVSAVRARTRKRISISLSVPRTKALQIADDLNLTTFSASNGFLQNWARRHDYVNAALHGAGSSAAVEEAAGRIVAYLLKIRILSPVAPLTGQYSRGGLNRLVARPLGGYFRLVYLSFLLSSLFWWLFDL